MFQETAIEQSHLEEICISPIRATELMVDRKYSRPRFSKFQLPKSLRMFFLSSLIYIQIFFLVAISLFNKNVTDCRNYQEELQQVQVTKERAEQQFNQLMERIRVKEAEYQAVFQTLQDSQRRQSKLKVEIERLEDEINTKQITDTCTVLVRITCPILYTFLFYQSILYCINLFVLFFYRKTKHENLRPPP